MDPGVIFGIVLVIILSPFILFGILSPFLFIYSMLFARLHQGKLTKGLLIREKSYVQAVGRDNIHTLSHTVPKREINQCGLVMANITIGPSWWQMFLGGIHSLFGGNITVYDRLLAFGRGEVLMRLREQSRAEGWDDVLNVRVETSMVMAKVKGKQQNKMGTLEFVAYGTGIR